MKTKLALLAMTACLMLSSCQTDFFTTDLTDATFEGDVSLIGIFISKSGHYTFHFLNNKRCHFICEGSGSQLYGSSFSIDKDTIVQYTQKIGDKVTIEGIGSYFCTDLMDAGPDKTFTLIHHDTLMTKGYDAYVYATDGGKELKFVRTATTRTSD